MATTHVESSRYVGRTCLHCDELTPRQSVGQPRKFCSDACRSEYHNSQRRSGGVAIIPVAERLAAKLSAAGECLEFTGHRNEHGYGVIRHGSAQLAHRVAWQIVNGPIPAGMCVRHSCDNPPCCRIEHLSLGTHAENMVDRDIRGRTLKGAALRKARWGR